MAVAPQQVRQHAVDPPQQHRQQIREAADQHDARPRRQFGVEGQQQPGRAGQHATQTMPIRLAAQKRAAIAGSIIWPTAISVPRVWKALTRLATTSTSNRPCTHGPAALTLRRKPASTLSITSGRQASASASSVRLQTAAISASAASSIASTLPNSTCSRSAPPPRSDSSSTPSASATR